MTVPKIRRIKKSKDSVEVEYGPTSIPDDPDQRPVMLLLRVTDEGIIIDVTDGEVVQSAWQTWDDLLEMTH
jgi:hypothetical protein